MFTLAQKSAIATLASNISTMCKSKTFTDKAIRIEVAEINSIVATEARLRRLEENAKRFHKEDNDALQTSANR